MPLNRGTRLGAYEILTLLGVGGMGEVYRARDPRLGRDVAIKVLPDSLAGDPERLARLEREAKTLASLNHPNIAHIYGVEDSTGVPALVMELVEGPTLADRIEKGPISLDEALLIAKQIAEALEAAHEQGIIHRDLKPANIKVRPDGTVKVLDFGLAKAFEPAIGASATISPTLSIHATQAGIILGTAAYMSPEQARSKGVDKRADIWAFGAVLYEMLTARRAFDGEETSDTLAFVITREPEWSALSSGTPPAIQKLLRRCLEKDRKRRLADIVDARLELEDVMSSDRAAGRVPATTSVFEAATAHLAYRRLLWAITIIMTAVALTVTLLWAPWKATASSVPVRLSVDLGVNISRSGVSQSIEISPVGDTIALTGEGPTGTELYIRRLDQLTPMRIAGTHDAVTPVFSPDGQWIAYFARGQWNKVPVNGGASAVVTDAPSQRGGAWGDDGSLVIMPGLAADTTTRGLARVSANGGTLTPLTRLNGGELTHRWPQMLTGRRALLFTASDTLGAYENANIVIQRLPEGPRKTIVAGGYHGRYVPSGHIVYMHAGTLWAVPFDLERLETIGPAAKVVEGVDASPASGAANFAVSNTGTLVYVAAGEGAATAPIMWLTRGGESQPLRTVATNWGSIQFSPDGRRIAFDVRGAHTRIWTYDWARDTATQMTIDPGDQAYPTWSPDGLYVAFAATPPGAAVANLFVQRADGAGDVVRLTNNRTNPQVPSSWHPSGKFIAFTEVRPGTSQDLMLLPLSGDSPSGWRAGNPTAFLASPQDEFDGVFSPDGRWLAYTSLESGTSDIYVRPFPGPGSKWKISTDDGGLFPVWSRTSHELLYRALDARRVMVVSYSDDGDSFHADKPQVWAEGWFGRPNLTRGFDLHPDGRRVAAPGGKEAEAQIRRDKAVFVFNFFDELRRIAPAKP